MALTRSEIEILIKARSQAQAAFDDLSRQVKTVTGEATKASTELEKAGKSTRGAGTAATTAGVAMGLLAERLARGLVGAFRETIAAANRLDSGLIGLTSVANAFKQDAGAAQAAAERLAADGLMAVGEAAGGLKNLLAAGFGLDQAVTLMERFKDSAAFGRQGALSFGEAIKGATEGIKNGNSILVDNAGVTKNLSQMLTEAGFSAQDLSKASSDVNVRMAIFNGILKETNPQLGDAARYAETAAGKQAAFSAQVEKTQALIGRALQPALASMLDTLTPLVQAIGNNAGAFTSLAAIVMTVVGPLAAMKVAAMLGIPSLTQLATSALGMASKFATAVDSAGSLRGGLVALAKQSDFTVAGLGLLKTAAYIAGAAFIGWQIGKIIDEFTGLSGAVERATVSLMGWSTAAQTAGAKQDTIAAAIRNGAAANITYADAVAYQTRIEDIRKATWDKSAAAQLKRIDAEVTLGRITTETANAQRTAVAADQQAQNVMSKRLSLSASIVATEKAYRDEIAATGYTQSALIGILKTNEAAFDSWAKKVGLSDETAKRLKDTLKQQTEGHKEAKKAAEEHAKELEKLAADLSALGVVSRDQAGVELAKLTEKLDAAAKIGTPALATALRVLLPELDALVQKARDSGLAVGGLTATIRGYEQSAGLIIQPTRTYGQALATLPTLTVDAETQDLIATMREEQRVTGEAADGFKYFGITSRAELQKTAQEAERHYKAIVKAVGKNAPEAVAAYKRMIDAQKAATGELPSFWRTDVLPKIGGVLDTLTTAVNGSFAQMLLGAKGFGEGFSDIWNSIKSAALNVLNSILQAFLNQFLKGMIGAMQGQSGGFSAAFSGMFSGGGTAGATGAGGVGGAGGMTGGFWSSGAGGATAGVGTAATSAYTGYQMGQKWGKGKGAAAGAASGAATGAMIGSVVPGLGTAIGAGIGALAGAVSGWLGGVSKERKENKQATEAIEAYKAKLLEVYGSLENIRLLGKGLGAELAGAWGDKGKAGIENFEAIMNRFLATQQKLQGALERYGFTWEELDQKTKQFNVTGMAAQMLEDHKALVEAGIDWTKVTDRQAQAFSELVQTAIRTGTVLPATMKPMIDHLAEVGLLLDADGKKIEDLGALFESLSDIKIKPQVEMPDVEDWVQSGDSKGVWNPSGVTVEGGAAGGVMAKRPGLVVFGEGGETEVGGPASFFRRIFEELGLGNLNAEPSINIGPFNITAMSATDMQSTMERVVIPVMIDALRVNRRGSRTDLQTVLEVT